MKVEVVSSSKDEMDLKIDNPTVAEIMRVYLYGAGAKFAVWRREHPSKPAVMKIQTSGKTVKKAVSEAVSQIKKEADAFSALFKKK